MTMKYKEGEEYYFKGTKAKLVKIYGTRCIISVNGTEIGVSLLDLKQVI